VKNRLHWSKSWKTFPDFLADYIKKTIGSEWGNAEIAKPESERHIIIQWYQAYSRYQATYITVQGEIGSGEVIGIVACYLGLAYNLYLLDHNVELQARMVARLKDQSNFQGAYYELIIAGALIRAGFELVLEDESDRNSKHCEFAAVKKTTGKRYSVEAKMRSVASLLGKTKADGGTDDKPLSKLQTHLHAALAKPSKDERLVFLDLNAPMDADVSDQKRPAFLIDAVKRLAAYEKNPQAPAEAAYVFLTNMAFHRHLDGRPALAVVPVGFRIPDFNRAGYFTHIERYRQEQKHKDALEIAEALGDFPRFPATFDGSLLSENRPGERPRIMIGETYDFVDVVPGGIVGTVTSAIVQEHDRTTMIGVSARDGKSYLLREKMSDTAFGEYMAHKDAYFGEVRRVNAPAKDSYDFFCKIMQIYAEYNRTQLARQIGKEPNDKQIAHLSDSELREFICDRIVGSLPQRPPEDAQA
jgi:hypothetical protein